MKRSHSVEVKRAAGVVLAEAAVADMEVRLHIKREVAPARRAIALPKGKVSQYWSLAQQ